MEAGCTCTTALEITEHSGIELMANWVLMLVADNELAVVVACAAPFSCSITTSTTEVANSLLDARVCLTFKNIRHLSHITGLAELSPQVPQCERSAKTRVITVFFAVTSAADNGNAICMETVYTLFDINTHMPGTDQV